MAINPLALAITSPDTVGKAFQGFEYGRKIAGENALAKYGMAASGGDQNALAAVYQADPNSGMAITQSNRQQATLDDAKRLEGLKGLARMGQDILRLPPAQRGPAIEQAKQVASQMYGLDPASLHYVTPDTIDELTSTVQSEYDRLLQSLNLQSSQLGVQGQQLDIQGKVDSNNYWRAQMGGASSPGAPSMSAPAGTYNGGPGAPVSNGKDAVLSVYPNAYVTSNYRTPDDPLSKANPTSWHTQSHGAVDVRPIPGMTFDQYVQGFVDKGYKIIEAKNEVGAGRSKWATGDHWHIVLGGGPGAAPPGGAGDNASQPPAAQPLMQQGNSFTSGATSYAAPANAGGQGTPAPSPAPAAPQSIAELAASDPIYQRYASEAVKAQRFGNTAGAAQANALAEARLKELGATLPPVLSAKDQAAANKAGAKAQNASNALVEAAKSTLGTIQEARNMVNQPEDFRTGMGGAIAAYIPGSPARDLSNAILTLKSNLSFEALQQMRANSPTGGALGNVSDSDLKLLASQVAALDYTGSKEKLLRDLDLVERHYQRILDAAQADAQPMSGTASEDDALLKKYGIQ